MESKNNEQCKKPTDDECILGIMFPFDGVAEALVATHREPALTSLFLQTTKLGDVGFILVATIVACMFLHATHRRRYIPQLVTTMIGSTATVWLLKILVELPRPIDPIPLITVDSYSFPSGHAAAAMALYGFCIYLALGTGKISLLRVTLTSLFGALILLVGFSRLYLGVHYPSDVFAGYAIGLAWIALSIWLSKHGRDHLIFFRKRKA